MLVAAQTKGWICSRSCWDSGFEFCRGHRYLSLVSVVCCQVEVCEGLLTHLEESYRV